MKRPTIFRIAVLFLYFTVSVSLVFATRRERLIDSWRPLHYSVEATLDNKLTELVTATTQIQIETLKKLSAVDLDFGELTTDRVLLNSSPVHFDQKDGKLIVALPAAVEPNTKLTLTVVYHGKPKDGLIMTNDKDGKPAAVGDNWPDRVHNWIPCLDHPSAKATVTFKITAPENDLVVANGSLDSTVTTSPGTKTWTYSEEQPIPPYCMIIAVGQFAHSSSLLAGPPLSFYVPQADASYAPKGFSPAGAALLFFSETVGRYPYEKLALIIGATRFGGMENSSAIVFPSSLFNPRTPPRPSRTYGIPTAMMDTVAHEIAHQWFGDSVTEATWSDLWLSEGFATYFAGLFLEKKDGEEAFQQYMKDAANAAIAYDNKKHTPIFDPQTENLSDLLNANNYQKGAWVLHMLRLRLGDDVFFRGIRSYYEQHKGSTATSEDLRAALEKAFGQDLKPFFQRWVYESGHPQYELSWNWDNKAGAVKLTLNQRQPGNAFLDPVQLRIVTATGERIVQVLPTDKSTVQSSSQNDRPQRIEIDPHNVLLKEVVSANP